MRFCPVPVYVPPFLRVPKVDRKWTDFSFVIQSVKSQVCHLYLVPLKLSFWMKVVSETDSYRYGCRTSPSEGFLLLTCIAEGGWMKGYLYHGGAIMQILTIFAHVQMHNLLGMDYRLRSAGRFRCIWGFSWFSKTGIWTFSLTLEIFGRMFSKFSWKLSINFLIIRNFGSGD